MSLDPSPTRSKCEVCECYSIEHKEYFICFQFDRVTRLRTGRKGARNGDACTCNILKITNTCRSQYDLLFSMNQ